MDLQNYHEWIEERQRLLERIKELEAENAELKKRLGEDVVHVVHEPTAMHKLSAQEKVELFRSVFKGREAVAPAVTFYNEERPHMSINMMTPKEASNCTGELKKHWTSYREMHIKEKQKATFIGNARENISVLLHNP